MLGGPGIHNLVAVVHLVSRGRGAATLSEAFNSNVFNVIVGLLLPGTILGLASAAGAGFFVAAAYAALTCAAVARAYLGRGLDHRSGAVIIGGYLGFVVLMAM
jgi:hypothetical protein